MKYRAEIDGLRAVAILPVMLFHAGVSGFSGGFVGVDVFFVISGYLITSIILAELDAGKFSLVTFYERRARRILPALFLVMAVTWLLGWMWLIPSAFKELSSSIIAVITFSSNILFWQTSGYFDTSVDLKPLLHTWSLAVEEQFYLLFPLLLMVCARARKRTTVLLITVGILASLALAQVGSTAKPIAAFYLLPTRWWEMGVGALTAFVLARPHKPLGHTWAQTLSLVGLALILSSVVLYTKTTPFPGIYALVPTIGAALIILYASPATWTGAVLSLKPVVGIGLISYSTYLWHQPVFAMARHRSLDEPDASLLVPLACASLALGYLSWRFVEAPFRNKTRIGRRAIFTFAAAGSALFLLVGLAGYMTDGFRERAKWDGLDNAFETQMQRGSGERYCEANHIDSPLGPRVCVIGDTSKKPDGVLWGDSDAGALIHGLSSELRSRGRAFYAVLGDGCVPIEHAWRIAKLELGCTETRNATFIREVLKRDELKTIVWVGRFSGLTNGTNKDFLINGVPPSHEGAKADMLNTVRKLQAGGKQVILASEGPRFPHYAAEFAIRRYAATDGDLHAGIQTVSRAALSTFHHQADIMQEAASMAAVVDTLSLFCKQDTCSTHDEAGRLLLIDNGHLSHIGSARLAQAIAKHFNDKPTAP